MFVYSLGGRKRVSAYRSRATQTTLPESQPLRLPPATAGKRARDPASNASQPFSGVKLFVSAAVTSVTSELCPIGEDEGVPATLFTFGQQSSRADTMQAQVS